MKEAAKNFANKIEVKNAFDLGDNTRGKIKKLQTFVSSYFDE